MSAEGGQVISIWVNKRGTATLLEPTTCYDDTHMFRQVPGRCECGQEMWEPEPPPKPPKLRLVE